MLELQGLRLAQGGFTLEADLRLSAPGVVAILGPSGAGKSTLLSAVAGFLTPQDGRILWEGRDLTPLAPGARPLSVIFQDQNLFPHLTVERNLALGLSPRGRLAADDRDRISDVLARLGLSGLASRRPPDLSGGQASRVALARALLRARPLTLLDEPFAALGPALKSEMLDLTTETLSGTLTLMVTHDPGDARRIATRTILVAGGIATGPHDTAQLLDNPPEALARYLGA